LKTLFLYKDWLYYEFIQEIKSRRLLVTACIQAIAFVIILFQSIPYPSPESWIAFYWLIAIFGAISGLSRSFIPSTSGVSLYIYQMIKPGDFFLIKWSMNAIYIFLLSLCTLIFLWLFYGHMPVPIFPFLLLVFMASCGFSALFTFTGVMSAQGNHAGVLLPLISIPLLIPLILLVVEASTGLSQPDGSIQDVYREFLLICLLDLCYFLPGLFLFPHLWGE
jgi:heme exporter protein B